MKTFKDLKFEPHPSGSGKAATMFFPNGYGISVVRFMTIAGIYGSYTDNENEWEVAVLKRNYGICYDTPITDDVIGHLSDEEVTEVMQKIQQLDHAETN